MSWFKFRNRAYSINLTVNHTWKGNDGSEKERLKDYKFLLSHVLWASTLKVVAMLKSPRNLTCELSCSGERTWRGSGKLQTRGHECRRGRGLTLSLTLRVYHALAGVPLWLEHQPEHQRVEGLILRQGHGPGLQTWSLAPVGMHDGGNKLMCLT